MENFKATLLAALAFVTAVDSVSAATVVANAKPKSKITRALEDAFLPDRAPRAQKIRTGGMSGGGGRAIVCRNADRSIRSAELLDLYEARVLFGLTLRSAESDLDRELNRSFATLELNLSWDLTSDPTEVADDIQMFHTYSTFIAYPNVLKSVDDSEEPVIPQDCAIEQAAYFYQDQRLLIQKEIWDSFDDLNKSALYVHEMTYFMARAFDDVTNSRTARKYVGYFFSTTPPSALYSEYLPLSQRAGTISCASIGTGAVPLSFVMNRKSTAATQIAYGEFLTGGGFFRTITKDLTGDFYDRVSAMLKGAPSSIPGSTESATDYTETSLEDQGFDFPSLTALGAIREPDPSNPGIYRNKFAATAVKYDGSQTVIQLNCIIVN